MAISKDQTANSILQMDANTQLTFKIADTPDEFAQIHQMNYATFVEEIPQHPSNTNQVLIDKFHGETVYVICLNETGELVGMICLREKRPFSLDSKIANLDDLLPPNKHVCEIRLLSVKREYRNGRVFVGMIKNLAGYCLGKGFDMAIISGTSRQQKLYGHLGFKVFAEPVGTPEALYYPMYLTVEDVLPEIISQ